MLPRPACAWCQVSLREGFCLAVVIPKCFKITWYLTMHPDLLILIANWLLKALEFVPLKVKSFHFIHELSTQKEGR